MIVLSLLSLFCVLVTNALFDVYHSEELYSYLGLIFYFYFTIVFITNLYHAPQKTPLKYTKRMTRLNIAMFVFVTAFSFVAIAFSTEYINFLKFGTLCLVPLFIPLFVPLVHLILIPLESLIMATHLHNAKKKLSKMPNLIKIGITGSFAKTSTKYILNTILSVKYKVCMSPHSFNTLPGISKVVNNYLNLDDQILICEMGARHKGDIKKLCDLIKPKYAVITGVGTQHLETFKTYDNILDTKFELVQSLPTDGKTFFNGFDDGAKTLFDRCKFAKQITSGVDDVKDYDKSGTTFDLTIGDKTYKDIKTLLIGEHNVQNVIAIISLCLSYKIDLNIIKIGLNTFENIERRFEYLGDFNSNRVIHDYAHHPSEIKTVINTCKQVYGKKIVCIFQPHTYSRTKLLMEEFLDCFNDCDDLLIVQTYSAREKYIYEGSAELLCKNLKKYEYFRLDTTYYENRPALYLYDAVMDLREDYTTEDTDTIKNNFIIYTYGLNKKAEIKR